MQKVWFAAGLLIAVAAGSWLFNDLGHAERADRLTPTAPPSALAGTAPPGAAAEPADERWRIESGDECQVTDARGEVVANFVVPSGMVAWTCTELEFTWLYNRTCESCVAITVDADVRSLAESLEAIERQYPTYASYSPHASYQRPPEHLANEWQGRDPTTRTSRSWRVDLPVPESDEQASAIGTVQLIGLGDRRNDVLRIETRRTQDDWHGSRADEALYELLSTLTIVTDDDSLLPRQNERCVREDSDWSVLIPSRWFVDAGSECNRLNTTSEAHLTSDCVCHGPLFIIDDVALDAEPPMAYVSRVKNATTQHGYPVRVLDGLWNDEDGFSASVRVMAIDGPSERIFVVANKNPHMTGPLHRWAHTLEAQLSLVDELVFGGTAASGECIYDADATSERDSWDVVVPGSFDNDTLADLLHLRPRDPADVSNPVTDVYFLLGSGTEIRGRITGLDNARLDQVELVSIGRLGTQVPAIVSATTIDDMQQHVLVMIDGCEPVVAGSLVSGGAGDDQFGWCSSRDELRTWHTTTATDGAVTVVSSVHLDWDPNREELVEDPDSRRVPFCGPTDDPIALIKQTLASWLERDGEHRLMLGGSTTLALESSPLWFNITDRRINGYIHRDADHIELQGTVTALTSDALTAEATITSRRSDANAGLLCVHEGLVEFVYDRNEDDHRVLRLEMQNCDGRTVDIFELWISQ